VRSTTKIGERAALLRLSQGLPLRFWCERTTFPSVDCHWCRVTVQETARRNCLRRHGGAVVVSGTGVERGSSDSVQCQIVDVFALKVVTVSPVDPTAVAAGGDASVRLAELVAGQSLPAGAYDPDKAVWLVLQRNHKAWGLFWAGGGTGNRCGRTAGDHAITTPGSAIVPGDAKRCWKARPNLQVEASLQRRQAKRLFLLLLACAASGVLAGCLCSCLAARAGRVRCTFPGVLGKEQDRNWSCCLSGLPAPVNR